MELVEHARVMLNAAGQISLTASGQSQSVEGEVSITCSDLVAAFRLPLIIEKIRIAAPNVQVRIIVSNEYKDIGQREADIAVRHARPEQPDLVARKVALTRAHLFAASSYLEKHGRPAVTSDLADMDFIGSEYFERTIRVLNAKDLPVSKSNFKVIADNSVTVWELVQQGIGIAVMTDDIAEATPGIEKVLPDAISIELPIWLATHREVRTSRRIRLVFDVLAEELSPNSVKV